MRNPGTSDVLRAEGLRVPRDIFDLVAELFIREVPADGLQSLRIQLLFELLGSQLVSSGELNVLNAKVADAVER